MTDPRLLDPAGERRCVCVITHSPQVDKLELERHHVWPLGKDGPDIKENLRWLCGSTHNQVHRLWRFFERYDGMPPNWIARTFSPYVRNLVMLGWTQMKNAGNRNA